MLRLLYHAPDNLKIEHQFIFAGGGKFSSALAMPPAALYNLRVKKHTEERDRMYAFIKRLMDILLSLPALIVLSPAMAVIALLVRITSPGPAIFRQKRSGKNLREFEIYKFRTMYVTAPGDTPTHQLSGAQNYITPLGAFLRRTSLDELPQLWNILKGDMSIVGPRPPLPTQYDLIAAREKLGANALRPGLTGWAQINGRDELPIEVKAGYDGEYVRRMSFLFDLRCIFGTVAAVFGAKGVKEGRQE